MESEEVTDDFSDLYGLPPLSAWDSRVEGYHRTVPPSSFGESFFGHGELAWDSSITGTLVNKWMRDEEELIQEDASLGETVTPNEAAVQYPGITYKIKSPMTRAELQIREAESKQRQGLHRSLQGEVMNSPDFLPQLAGSVGGSLLDPLTVITGILSFGSLSSVPALRGLLTASNLYKSQVAARGSAAALLALDGAAGNLLYGTVNAGVQRLDHKPYTLGDLTTQTLIGAGFGGAIGGIFPGAASVGPWALKVGDSKQFVSNLRHLKSMLNDPQKRGKFWEHIRNEKGGLDLRSIGDALAGRNPRVKDILDDVAKQVTTDDITVSLRGADAGKKIPALVYSRSRYKMDGSYHGLHITKSGVHKMYGWEFERPLGFYHTEGMSIDATAHFTPDKTNWYINTGDSEDLFFNIPNTADAALQEGVHFHVSSSPHGVINHVLSKLDSTVPEIRVGALRGRNFKILNLESPLFPEMLKEAETKRTIPVGVSRYLNKIPRTQFRELSDVDASKAIQGLLSDSSHDGVLYNDVGRGTTHLLLNPDAVKGFRGIADKVLTVDTRRKGGIASTQDVQYFLDTLQGKTDTSVPTSVNHIVDDFYRSFKHTDEVTGETTNFFDNHIRQTLHDIEYTQGGVKRVLLSHEGNQYTATTPLGEMSESARNAIVEISDRVLNVTPSFSMSLRKITETEEAIEGGKPLLELFKNNLVERGFKFPAHISEDISGKHWAFTGESTFSPWGEKTLKQLILEGSERSREFDDTFIRLSTRTLRLDVHPSLMSIEGLETIKKALEDSDPTPTADIWGNVTKVRQGVIQGFLSPEKQAALKSLGYTKVRYVDGDIPKEIELTGKGTGTAAGSDYIATGKQLRDAYLRLGEVKPEKAVAEGVEVEKPPVNERTKEFKNFLTQLQGKGTRSLYWDAKCRYREVY